MNYDWYIGKFCQPLESFGDGGPWYVVVKVKTNTRYVTLTESDLRFSARLREVGAISGNEIPAELFVQLVEGVKKEDDRVVTTKHAVGKELAAMTMLPVDLDGRVIGNNTYVLAGSNIHGKKFYRSIPVKGSASRK